MALSLNDYLHSLGLSSYNINDVLYHLPDYLSSTYEPKGAAAALYAKNAFAPAGAIAETAPRGASPFANSSAILGSGGLRLSAVYLHTGDVVTNINWLSGATPAAISTHCWFCLYSPLLAKLAVTTDDTSASPWAANTLKTLPLVTPYTVPTTGLYYMGMVVVATTAPTFYAQANSGGVAGSLPPVISGPSTTGLTDPASAPVTASAIGSSSLTPYGYVS